MTNCFCVLSWGGSGGIGIQVRNPINLLSPHFSVESWACCVESNEICLCLGLVQSIHAFRVLECRAPFPIPIGSSSNYPRVMILVPLAKFNNIISNEVR